MVNALWAGGAEAMVIMELRVISTSAVRCVGNTLLLHGQVFSPPFVIRAIGDPARMRGHTGCRPGRARLPGRGRRVRPGVRSARTRTTSSAPAYVGPAGLDHATAVR